MKTWSDMMVSQELAGKILTNSIKKDRISHAYLLQGGRGTGKESIAFLLAKTLFCLDREGVEPCQVCRNCKRIASKNHPDVHWIEPSETMAIRNEQINALKAEFKYSGLESVQKVYVIKAADTLTLQAANRILKFLEEPNKKTTAILLTENSQSIIPTIRSRCQAIDLQPLNPSLFQQQLMDAGITKDDAVFFSALTNNLEEAISWNKADWFAQARKLMVQWIEISSTRTDDIYLFLHQHWLPHFKDREQLQQGLDLLMIAFKDLLYFHIEKEESMVVFTSQDEVLHKAVPIFSEKRLLTALTILLKAKQKLKQRVNSTLVMEQLTLHI
ncbi:DNA polymerase III subunit delta' [Virgibacillus sp. W0181]|uniref:DNA polymerase III subunit delta' n=1 Tax=Virgibacillus sp. W0181 TaxID=3391581 RepID=UPI003F4607E1